MIGLSNIKMASFLIYVLTSRLSISKSTINKTHVLSDFSLSIVTTKKLSIPIYTFLFL
jgi:hypothetical protein